MRSLQARIREATQQTGMNQLVIEKDYALSYVLAGLATHPRLAEALIFKGGTALKKNFFGNYRFSEDLDFSAVHGPVKDELEEALRMAVDETSRLLRLQGRFDVEIERYEERDPHPGEQEAFKIGVRFPWYPEPLCRVKVEITHDEPVLVTPESRPSIHGYAEDLVVNIRCYSLEEIVAEKMRTLLQGYQILVARGWVRSRARHYYDLWRILNEFGQLLRCEALLDLLKAKSSHREVSFNSLEDFFPEKLISDVHKSWEQSLGAFVPGGLPSCEEVLEGLRSMLPSFFPAMG